MQFFLGFILNLAAVSGDDGHHFRLTDDFAQHGLRRYANRLIGALHIKEVVFGIFNPPNDCEVDVDNVFISGEHMAFVKSLELVTIIGIAASGKRCGIGSVISLNHTQIDASLLRNINLFHGLYRIRQMIVQAGIGGALISAKPQNDTFFVRLNLIKAGSQPDQKHQDYAPLPFELETVRLFDFGKIGHFRLVDRFVIAFPRVIIVVIPRIWYFCHVYTPILFCIALYHYII